MSEQFIHGQVVTVGMKFQLTAIYGLRTVGLAAQKKFKFHCARLKLIQLGCIDDLLLFHKGDIQSVIMLYDCYMKFSVVSDFKANTNKSSIYFGGVEKATMNQILQLLEFSKSDIPFRHLDFFKRFLRPLNAVLKLQVYAMEQFHISKRYMRLLGVFPKYTAGEVTEMRGHLLKYPVEIDLTEKVKLLHAYGRTVRSVAHFLAKYQNVKIYFVSHDMVKMKDDIKDYLTSMGVYWEESDDLLEVASKCGVVYQTHIQRENFEERVDLYKESRGKYIVDLIVLNAMQKHAVITVDVDGDLKATDLSTSEVSTFQDAKVCDLSYQDALPEVLEILKSACETHGLPLAQT
ncbi:Aspartate carbamoyltransferase, chloroplastic [Capsicum chinense]|nr:Aspartate carbamoyltransferase, chloroplastic [Capsicum chinense]